MGKYDFMSWVIFFIGMTQIVVCLMGLPSGFYSGKH